MIKIKSIIIILSVILGINFSYAETQTQFFSFTKTKGNVNEYISGSKLMDNFLVGNADNFISEIECDSIRTRTWGIVIATIWDTAKGTHSNSSLKIFFNPDKLMKVKSLTFYVNLYENGKDNEDPKLNLYFNGDLVKMPTLPLHKEYSGTGSTIGENAIKNSAVTTSWVSPDLEYAPMQEIELKSNFINAYNDVQVLGFTVEYDGVTKDTETGVEELDADTNVKVEYFDMMGRELPAAPTNGLYIEKVGTKATKRFAH